MKTKVLISIFVCLCSHMMISAQENTFYGKGHINTVTAGISLPYYWSSLSISHGHAFGNGLFIGAGVGLDYMSGGMDGHEYSWFVPLFADVKYSFIDKKISPFLDLKGGALCDCTSSGMGYVLSPSVGLDIWRFSVSIGYELRNISYRVEIYDQIDNENIYGDRGPVAGHSSIMIGNNRMKLAVSYSF